MKNEGFIERGIQLIISATLSVGAIFWLSGFLMWLAGIFSIVILSFAIIGFCPLYAIFGIKKTNLGRTTAKNVFLLAAVYLLVLISVGYASDLFTKKFFIEDFNAMNKYYKQTLFETGQEKRAEATINYDLLLSSYAEFQEKYSSYQPYVLRKDRQFTIDLEKVRLIIADVQNDVYSGDLKNAHLALEKVRPITQEMFKRNGFSMLAISLVDFHDSMEKVIEQANVKNSAGVILAYREADDKLLAVEKEATDSEIQAIRSNLDALLKLAQDNNSEALPNKGAELKSSFVKVYLKRG